MHFTHFLALILKSFIFQIRSIQCMIGTKTENQDEVGEEYSMVLPDSSLYKDFNSETDFIDLKMDNIEVYLKPMEKTIDSDAKKYTKKFIFKYICLGLNLTVFFIYVKTECRARMKRSVTYKVDIAIDEHGSIDNVNVNVLWGWDQMHIASMCAVFFWPFTIFQLMAK